LPPILSTKNLLRLLVKINYKLYPEIIQDKIYCNVKNNRG